MTPPRPLPATTIVVPTLNEAERIEAVLANLLRPGDGFVVELIVADGGSSDGTQALVRAAAKHDPRIRLVDNRKRLQSAGVNLAARLADPRSEVILRADAHARYPADFAERVVSALVESGADSVVVRMRSVGESWFQRAVASVSNSVIGTGGAAHRSGGRPAFVDHGHHAAFRRRVFDEIGGYDEAFAANEDAELDSRIRAAGGRIWFPGDVDLIYYPRSTPAALARQYWRYGCGRAQTFLKHGERLRLRQMLPQLMVLSVIGGLLLAPFLPVMLAFPLTYGLTVTGAGIWLAFEARDARVLAAPLALAAMHFAWGAGFLWTVLPGLGPRRARVEI